MTHSRLRPVLVSCLALGLASGVLAQDEGGDGRILSFGLSQGLTLNDNLALDAESAGTTVQAETGLTFALVTETATDRFAVDAALGLRIVDGPATDGIETDLSDPRIALSYSRLGARAQLDLDLSLSRSDIAFLRPLSDFGDDLPDDLDDLTGTGTREALAFDARLELATDRRFGVTLRAAHDRLAYADVTDPDLVDNQRSTAGLGLRFDLSSVATATLDLTHSRFEETGGPSRDTTSLAAALDLARPDGTLTFRLTADDTPDGTRTGLTLGRSFDRPAGGLDISLGLTRGVDGEISATGGVTYDQDYASGTFSAALRQTVTTGNDDAEQRVTALDLGLTHELGDFGTLALDAAWARTVETAGGTATDQADLGIALSRPLTRDWTADLGLRHTIRDDARDTALSLSIGRTFDLPF